MATPAIQFNDGAVYEETMGGWTRLAGAVFLDWLDPAPGLRWADIGCGNGAFTALLAERCAPAAVEGIDPSPAQIAYAAGRPGLPMARFREGDALALPFADAGFDAAVMALVIFFLPDPARGVAEMARVVRPGGLVGAYAWDFAGGGFPYEPVQAVLRAAGFTPPLPPSVDAGRLDRMAEFWAGAGLGAVETRRITVERSYPDFERFWAGTSRTGSLASTLAVMDAAQQAAVREAVRARVTAADGTVRYAATANAIKGQVPG